MRSDRSFQFSDSRGLWLVGTRLAIAQLGEETRGDVLPAAVAAHRVHAWCRDESTRDRLVALYESLETNGYRAFTVADIHEVIEPSLYAGFERGELVAVRMGGGLERRARDGQEEEVFSRDQVEGPKEDVPRVIKRVVVPEELSFVEIVLVDENGKPVPGEAFEIELPSGRVEKGKLGAAGTARVEGIPMGSCKIRFPERDRGDFL